MEPRTVAGTTILLASRDGDATWREVATVIEDPLADWFEPVANDAAQ